jgi:hypothetical protein
MPATVTVLDQSTANWGLIDTQFRLILPTETTTARELIRHRVEREVNAYNANGGRRFRGLIQPIGAELTLNGYRMGKRRQIDLEQQVHKAQLAFEANAFVLFINDRQVTELDHKIVLVPETKVTFLRLLPLVGG